MTLDALRAAYPAYPANESAVSIAYGELLGGARAAAAREAREAQSRWTPSGLGTHLLARWRQWRIERDEAARLESLAPLAPQLLRDIGVSDEHRSIAIARHASQYERAQALPEAAAITTRFGTW